jgi:hypothetical protein
MNSKYLLRRLTRRLRPETLSRLISISLPFLFPVTEVLYRFPVAGRGFRFAIPVANYVGQLPLSLRQRYRWSKLDTFDMLAPRYDQPLTEEELRAALADCADVERLPNPGLNVVGIRRD